MTNTKKFAIPVSINEEIINTSLRHAIFLQKFSTHEVNKIIALINREIIPDLVSQMQTRLNNVGRYPGHLTTVRLKSLYESNKQILRVGLAKAYTKLSESLKDFAISEAEWQAKVLNKLSPDILGLDFITPAPATMRAVVNSRPFQGKILKSHFSRLSVVTQSEIRNSIKVGVFEGETTAQIMRRVRGSLADSYTMGNLGRLRRDAETITRTAVAHTTSSARHDTYKENSDVLIGWEFIATLDARTTEMCMVRDGRVYSLDNSIDRPPLHYQCRSDHAPALKSWQELDLPNIKEVPASTRAALGGPVSAKINYEEWLFKQPKKMQELALGKGRAELFRQGKLPFEHLINYRGKPLSLDQLRRLSEKVDGIKMPAFVKREIMN